MPSDRKPSLNELVSQYIAELEKDKTFLEQIETKIEYRYTQETIDLEFPEK